MSGVDRRGYALCTNGRSGSNWLCELLSSTGRLGHPLEYFNAEGRRRREDPAYPAEPARQLERIVTSGATSNGVYGVKVFPSHLDAIAGHVSWSALLPRLHFVRLIRRDRLGQALSFTRSVQTQRFRSDEVAAAQPSFDGPAIHHHLIFLARQEARWDVFFARNGLAPLTLAYEELLRDPQAAVNAVARLVGVEAAPIDPSAVRERIGRDALSDVWRDRYVREYRTLDRVDDV